MQQLHTLRQRENLHSLRQRERLRVINTVLCFCLVVAMTIVLSLHREASTLRTETVRLRSLVPGLHYRTGGPSRKRRLQDFRSYIPLDGVHTLMLDWGCGHLNLETPRALLQPGRSRLVVDIGLGTQAIETLAAVEAGYHVIAIEPNLLEIELIQGIVERRNLSAKVKFILPERTFIQQSNGIVIPKLPEPPLDSGFAYIIQAGMGSELGNLTVKPNGEASFLDQSIPRSSRFDVIVFTLDALLLRQAWIQNVFLLKIDTQGFELKILRGAAKLLAHRRIRYVLYELSPWLMRNLNTGSSLELVRLLPSYGALCFDMFGYHNRRPRPSIPLTAYLSVLNSALNSGKRNFTRADGLPDFFGPWDDILCWMPGHQLQESYENVLIGHKDFTSSENDPEQ